MRDGSRRRYRFLKPVKKTEDSILERPEFSYPEPPKETETPAGRVNYLRLPRSPLGSTALCAALMALVLSGLCVHLMVVSLGNPPLYVSAMAFSAMVLSLYGILCGLLSFRERDKSHLISLIGIAVGGVVFVTWVITVIVGVTE